MNRLILLVESRIRGNVYVRFGGEHSKTHRRNTAGRWVLSLRIDGKTICGSRDKNKKSIVHMVSAWAGVNNIVLGQVKVDDKIDKTTKDRFY